MGTWNSSHSGSKQTLEVDFLDCHFQIEVEVVPERDWRELLVRTPEHIVDPFGGKFLWGLVVDLFEVFGLPAIVFGSKYPAARVRSCGNCL